MNILDAFEREDLLALRLSLEQMVVTNNGGFEDLRRAKKMLIECREKIAGTSL